MSALLEDCGALNLGKILANALTGSRSFCLLKKTTLESIEETLIQEKKTFDPNSVNQPKSTAVTKTHSIFFYFFPQKTANESEAAP